MFQNLPLQCPSNVWETSEQYLSNVFAMSEQQLNNVSAVSHKNLKWAKQALIESGEGFR